LEAIKASNITKNYKQGMFKKSLRAIEDLSISVEEGEVFGFLGPNGAGKTFMRTAVPLSSWVWILKIPQPVGRLGISRRIRISTTA
jgi:ABC-type phosphate transport system ATPase subunit